MAMGIYAGGSSLETLVAWLFMIDIHGCVDTANISLNLQEDAKYVHVCTVGG